MTVSGMAFCECRFAALASNRSRVEMMNIIFVFPFICCCAVWQLVRMPLCLWCAFIAVRDVVLKLRSRCCRPAQDSKDSNGKTKTETGDPLISLDSVQPVLMVPSAIGSFLIAGLDVYWLATWSLPIIMGTRIPGRGPTVQTQSVEHQGL